MDLNHLSPTFATAPQLQPADIGGLAAAGFKGIINNRPDNEDPDQPASDDIEAAAKAAGLDYRHVPIARGLGPSDIEAMRDAINSVGDGKLFAFCRSGNRSALAWAVARSEDGVPSAELEAKAGAAGFDLGPVAHLIRD